ncbi:chloride channel protein [Leekyejoonella antrihumi]|uniref:CBS domain-containing protein n=1 Tax=Leekyejoonella antrihumi TaxID=1660198 RepID=A0A563DTP0_9MICO|nr:chloride channel protein [Leekyejoonella antrihumi]TWP33536.1 CBS domain-containing protein [Leekyejoonella antrihumi]
MTAMGVILGLVGGFAAVLLFKMIGLITHLTLLHDVGTDLPSLRGYHPGPLLLLVTIGGAVLVSLMAAWSPVIRGHGIPESLEAILTRDSRIRPRAAVAKPLSAAICIGTGGPFGAEGPIIVTGGSVGSLLGQALSVSPTERKILLATGAAAGMSATFNAPLAAIVLAIELLLFERSMRTIIPVATAAAVAAAIRVMLMGAVPLFAVQRHLSVSPLHLPLFIVVGALAGLLAVVMDKGLFAAEAGFRALPVRQFWWPIIGAAAYGIIGLFVPRTLSMGYSAITDTLNGHFAIGMLGTLFIAKLISWWFALGSQTSGGTLAPMFLVGATMGACVGMGLTAVFPSMHLVPAAFALVAMGAAFGAAAKAPFTAIIFCTEVTGEYSMIVPLIIGVVTAELVAGPFFEDRAMTEKLFHRGMRVDFDMWTGILHQRVVRQAMRPATCLDAHETVARAMQLMAAEGTPGVAVTEAAGKYLGVVFADDLARRASAQDSDRIPIGVMIDHGVRPLLPREFLDAAQLHLIEARATVLPVVKDGRVLGQLSRADIDSEHVKQRRLETIQPGALRLAGNRRRSRQVGAVATRVALDEPSPVGHRVTPSTMVAAVAHEPEPIVEKHRTATPPVALGRVDRLCERYADAAARLRGVSLTSRLTGAHAMAAVADDWLDLGDRGKSQECIDALCAYLRRQPGIDIDIDIDGGRAADTRVRETITRIITAHLQPTESPGWMGMDLDFTGARFTGTHTFDGAVFAGGRVSFEDTEFAAGEVSFVGMIITGGEVSFLGAEFSGCQVSFNFAEFAGGEVSFDGAGFTGSSVTFNFAEFSGGTVSFVGGARVAARELSFLSPTEFVDGEVSFEDAVFSGGEVCFDTAAFSGGQVSFQNAKFPGTGEVTFRSAAFDVAVSGPWPDTTPPWTWPPTSERVPSPEKR